MAPAPAPTHPLVRHLRSTTDITSDDLDALLSLMRDQQDVDKGYEVVREGDHPTRCCLLLTGFACRYKLMSDGSRQIVAFNVPGDLPDLLSLHLGVMDHSLATLAPSRLAYVPHDALRQLTAERPKLTACLWRQTIIDSSMFLEWMTGLGRRAAPSRLAHLICEVMARLAIVGLVDEGQTILPVTQADLADALGLSYVHVNRILQEFSREGLLDFRRRLLTVHDWPRLKEIAEFDPTYLHLMQPATID
ncbi:Crp/Fnr family transcriptional regulator [Consotaella salsifontis]|uniref:cAMP-binding domain of CRP or a regulatory subunit of cAMP-dependent protein kinases n=1 Tax=Consotaella salsifontis TaxID=1365950 RepID=A0A1T4PTL6_9HYPH|nr:Crp/Fnr family transcriptional regulator [Consotaella salsifontis]SJZ94577.1 cAMP-binding domain of CRP or a regulatory subunit of cAMP-dependent protein kinases [Consotaella salsifontis]